MNVVDDFVTVTDRESFAMARRLTREEGLFVGGSSGLIVHVAVQLAEQLNDPAALIVAILPDTGERYLSKLYSDEWMRENQLLEADRTSMGHVLRSKPDHKTDIVAIAGGQTVRQALRLMHLHDVSQLPVMEDANCTGSVSDWSLSARSLEDTKLLDVTVSQVMDPPFPVVDEKQAAENVAKLLSKSNPAVLVRMNGKITGIVTRSDLLSYLMSR